MGIFFGTGQKFFSQSIEFYPNVKLYQSCIVSLSYYHISDIHEASGRFEESGDQRASGATPDLLDNQYDDEYATMKFKSGPISQRPRAQTASLYLDSSQTPMLDQLHKNDLLHRSMTALQEYRDTLEQQQQAQQGRQVQGQRPAVTTADNFITTAHSVCSKISYLLFIHYYIIYYVACIVCV